uniref:Uncharacterized protein n=1 Tax=Candidatus Kentrum sp. TC TaxID=2126339 RepID=A0A451A4Y7_9GAMM|nr:MAG: hypothetical protein BECKTC1821F_GA0114240_10538 [Candidatus Kentron sp. TC]
MPQYASKRLKATEEKLLDALSGESTSHHVFVISETLDHIEDPKKTYRGLSQQLSSRLEPYKGDSSSAANDSRHRPNGSGYAGRDWRRKRTIFALAHEMLKIVFVLLSRSDYYRDAAINHEKPIVERNAPRWLEMLEKYGYTTVRVSPTMIFSKPVSARELFISRIEGFHGNPLCVRWRRSIRPASRYFFTKRLVWTQE